VCFFLIIKFVFIIPVLWSFRKCDPTTLIVLFISPRGINYFPWHSQQLAAYLAHIYLLAERVLKNRRWLALRSTVQHSNQKYFIREAYLSEPKLSNKNYRWLPLSVKNSWANSNMWNWKCVSTGLFCAAIKCYIKRWNYLNYPVDTNKVSLELIFRRVMSIANWTICDECKSKIQCNLKLYCG